MDDPPKAGLLAEMIFSNFRMEVERALRAR
jgi:hypothetical protein